jgi:methionine-rich copper-binding protein CopC
MLVVLALLIGGPSHAFAHAHLKGSQPVAGSSVEVAPRALTLSFTERLESVFCDVKVFDNTGNRVDLAQPVQHDSANPNVLHVALGSLPSGAYKVVWRVVGADGHAMTGSFSFTVL